MEQTLISIVIPTHNEIANVRAVYERLVPVFDKLPEHDFELIFCDDSVDSTPQEIALLHEQDSRVKLVRLSRRFGQAVAIAAGLDRASGRAAIMMDVDLQDPPEAIPEMIRLWREGNDVVYAERPSASNYFLYKFLARAYYRILKRVASVDIPLDAGEFRLLDQKVIKFMQQLSEHPRFLRGLTVWPGLRQAKITIARGSRSSGTTKYNFRRSSLAALDGIVSFSVVPLRITALFGALVAVLSLLCGLGFLIAKLLVPDIFGRGWPSVFVSIYFMGGIQLMFLGVLGEYIGRIFVEVQNRPLYWVDYELGFTTSVSRTANNTPHGHTADR
jgi:polyisoprenyl-phosphate glycosyltransferase